MPEMHLRPTRERKNLKEQEIQNVFIKFADNMTCLMEFLSFTYRNNHR